jgi:hypothetical protein
MVTFLAGLTALLGLPALALLWNKPGSKFASDVTVP